MNFQDIKIIGINKEKTNRPNPEKRNIVLKIETYERLDKYKIKLMSEKGKLRSNIR
jgi:hypothetical protein